MVSACVVRCSAARAGRPGDTDQREAGVRAALPLILCTCERARACMCISVRVGPGPLTQPKGPYIHTYVSAHTHTSLPFQNTQHLYKTAKQKKKVPNKTLQTSFSVTAKSLITVNSPLHSWDITPSNQAGQHYSTAHTVQEKHLFPPGVIISGNVSERWNPISATASAPHSVQLCSFLSQQVSLSCNNEEFSPNVAPQTRCT